MSDERTPCPPDEHCPSCTRDEEDECHRCGMSREDRHTQFEAWLDEVDDEATVVYAADAFAGWTRQTWPCDECSQVASVYVRGDFSAVRFVHGETGHELILPPVNPAVT